jgi:hypothetical protein
MPIQAPIAFIIPFMSKLFLLAIGGSGARVVRSLTMLFAAGMRLPGVDHVVPVLIDPDTTNGDVQRTVELLKRYNRLHKALYDGKHKDPAMGGFFSQSMPTLASLQTVGATDQLTEQFVYDLGGITKSFRDYLNYNTLPVETQGLLDLLFTTDSLSANLNVGFRGSPNVGSVVLNRLVDTKEMRYLAHSLATGDRVFFVSSIFGGTGAAGFPLLVKNLRDDSQRLPNSGIRLSVKTGALVLLPYFVLEQPAPAAAKETKKDFIDSNSFITKTKTALEYYATNLDGVQAYYYLGDQPGQPLENNPGLAAQQNPAHLLELIGALAVPHFAALSDNELDTTIGARPIYHEFGLVQDAGDEIDFSHFPADLRRKVARPLIQLHYFARFFQNDLRKSTSNSPFAKGINLAGELDNNVNLRELSQFFGEYNDWLREMGVQRRQLKALRSEEVDYNKMVADKPIVPGFFNKGLTDSKFSGELSLAVKNKTVPTNPDAGQVLRWVVGAFEQATEKLIDNELKFT